MIFLSLLTSWVLSTIVVIVGYRIWKWLGHDSLLPDLPVAGLNRDNWFPWLKVWIRSHKKHHGLLDEAYEKYLSHGQPCIMPEFNNDLVLLPPSSTQWLIDQSDQVLSASITQNELLASDYTMPILRSISENLHVSGMKTDLAKRLTTLTQETWDELTLAIDQNWGLDTENWKEINAFHGVMGVLNRAATRVSTGKDMCQNTSYLHQCQRFAEAIGLASTLIRLTPPFFRPVLGPILSLPVRYYIYRMEVLLKPEIEARLKNVELVDVEKGMEKMDQSEPNDFLQWKIHDAKKSLDAEKSTPHYLTELMAAFNVAAVNAATFTAVNAVYDLLSTPKADSYLAALRTECETISSEDGDLWRRSNLSKLIHVDSAIRESSRYFSFLSSALHRRVISKDGIVTPEGLHVKHGNTIAVSAHSAHRDAAIYPNPDSYSAFRFVVNSPFEEASPAQAAESNENQQPYPSTHLVDTSSSFLTFGHGKNSCPGRYFATNEIKMLIAYMVMNYDVEPLKERPAALSFGSIMVPNMEVNIRIRRKEKKV